MPTTLLSLLLKWLKISKPIIKISPSEAIRVITGVMCIIMGKINPIPQTSSQMPIKRINKSGNLFVHGIILFTISAGYVLIIPTDENMAERRPCIISNAVSIGEKIVSISSI